MIIGPFSCSYMVHGVGNVIAYFDNVYVASGLNEPFSAQGDSGSLVTSSVDGVNKAVGIVFAGDSQGLSYLLPINPILEYFNVSLVGGHNL